MTSRKKLRSLFAQADEIGTKYQSEEEQARNQMGEKEIDDLLAQMKLELGVDNKDDDVSLEDILNVGHQYKLSAEKLAQWDLDYDVEDLLTSYPHAI